MAINGINSVSASFALQDYDSDALKAKLAAAAKGQSVASASKDSDEDEETRIVTRTQADGSQVIMIVQGDKVISERRIGGNPNEEGGETLSIQTETLTGTSQLQAGFADAKIDQYEAGNAIAAGLVFNAAV